MSVTDAREKVVDFSNPYYHGGLGVAVAAEQRATLGVVVKALGSRAFLATIGALTVLLFIVGALAWLAERRRNAREFEPTPARGLFSGFWWAAVTMTTTGYGDKTPITVAGRLLGIAWMFSAVILTSLVTAQLSATLTAERIVSRVTTVADLARVRVGNVEASASLEALRALGVRPLSYRTSPAASPRSRPATSTPSCTTSRSWSGFATRSRGSPSPRSASRRRTTPSCCRRARPTARR